MSRATVPSKYGLHTYRVVYEDGHVQQVLGRWDTHAWAVAANMRPHHQIKSLSLVEKPDLSASQDA